MTPPSVRYLPYRLALEARMIVDPATGAVGDATSLDWLPGSMLRGAVAGRLLAAGSPAETVEFERLVLSGKVRYLPAYPVLRAGGLSVRGLPAPVSLRTFKGTPQPPDGGSVYDAVDLACYAGPRLDDPGHLGGWPDRPVEAFPAGYVTAAEDGVAASPPMAFAIHTARDPVKGHAWTETTPQGEEIPHGALFTYESLEAGQELAGCIQIVDTDDSDLDEVTGWLKDLLDTADRKLLFGRSHRTEYGGAARLTWQQARDREVDPTHNDLVVDWDVEAGERLRVVLVSPYLGRDPITGQPDPGALPATLEERLPVTVEEVFWSHGRVGGFNRKWGLPLPQHPSVAAGSVVVVTVTERLPLGDLLAVEHDGLGERRSDGYGRAVFLEHATTSDVLLNTPQPVPAQRPQEDPPHEVAVLERRLVEAAAARHITARTARLAATATTVPTASLLGRLRNLLRSDPEGTADPLAEPLGSGLAGPVRDRLDACRLVLGGDQRMPLSQWLLEVAGGDRDGELAVDAHASRWRLTDREQAAEYLTQQLPWLRAELIDALLAALSLRARREEP